jgi:hypothetical protein
LTRKFSKAEKSKAKPTQKIPSTRNITVPREKKNTLLKEFMGKLFFYFKYTPIGKSLFRSKSCQKILGLLSSFKDPQ